MGLFELSSARDSDFREVGMAKELWPHQRAALEYTLRARRLIIGDEVGVGKTVIPIAAARMLQSWPVVITGPAFLRGTWRRAIEEWLPLEKIWIVKPGENVASFRENYAKFLYVSYNLLEDYAGFLAGLHPQMFVADESHFIKGSKAKRTKAAKAIARSTPNRVLITGTPVLNRPKDLVTQLEVVGRDSEFGGSWRFLQNFCNRNGPYKADRWGHWDFSGARNLSELNRRLRETCYVRRLKSEVLPNLPPINRSFVYLDIPRAEYDSAARDFTSWVYENRGWEAMRSAQRAEALVKVSVLTQLTAKGKREQAEAWIENFLENGNKLVLFTLLRETAKHYAMRFNAPMILGGVDMEDREQIRVDFQENPGTKLIVVSMQAGGAGIDLFAAQDCAFVEAGCTAVGWNPGTYTQAIGRLHRPGQKGSVTAWFLLASGTIEETIYRQLAEREEVISVATQGSAEDEGGAFSAVMSAISKGAGV